MRKFLSSVLLSVLCISTSLADEPRVLEAEIKPQTDGKFTISVTVEHGDDGWDHFADAWEVLTPDGDVLAVRKLAHPHVNEQPFTRSKSGIEIPANVTEVIIRAHDLEHGYGEKTITIPVPRE